MSQEADSLGKAQAFVAEARLVVLFRSGRRKDAFEEAVSQRPALAAAFLTEAAEELRNSLLPSRLTTRAGLLEQAAATLGQVIPRGPEHDAAIVWLESRATEARAQAKELRITYVIVVGLVALLGLGLAYVLSS